MFMFRSKRKSLLRQLKARKKQARCNETRRAAEELSSSSSSSSSLLLLEEALYKHLNDSQLEMLMSAVDGRGHSVSNCVLLARDQHPHDPHVLVCQTYRWSDIRRAADLRRMPDCRSATDPIYICCNPYHWSRRLCQSDSPPPPYSHCAMDNNFKPEDRAPSEAAIVCRDSFIGSLTTSGDDDSGLNSRFWCRVAYWEQNRRVGEQFAVEPTALNVFGDIPCGDGLSLKELAQHSFSPPDSVCKTRCKIGLGVTLSREEDGIWLYNRSDHPVFAHSVTLEEPCIASPTPTRVPADHCLCVFDPTKAAHQNYGWNFTQPRGGGPIDRNSVQISFTKGWGSGYSRQDVMSCPCWIEVLLEPCR